MRSRAERQQSIAQAQATVTQGIATGTQAQAQITRWEQAETEAIDTLDAETATLEELFAQFDHYVAERPYLSEGDEG